MTNDRGPGFRNAVFLRSAETGAGNGWIGRSLGWRQAGVAVTRKKHNKRPKPVLAGSGTSDGVKVPAAEQILIDFLADRDFESACATSAGWGQLASALSDRGKVTLFCLDLWQADQAALLAANAGAAGGGERPLILCQADWPAGPFDLAAVPLQPGGSEELALDLFESAWMSLRDGGTLAVSVIDSARGWLTRHLRHFSRSVEVRSLGRWAIGTLSAGEPLARHRDWTCEFAFRDRGNLVRAVSRPGVFSHRRVDGGARQLLNSVEIEPGARVIDIGCGSGVVGLGIAARDPANQVIAVDSNARAVQCAQRGAGLNGLTNVEVLHTASPGYGPPASADLALGNPPYFSGYRIAGLFCEGAAKALRPGGRAVMVTRTPAWFVEHMPEWFENVETAPAGTYHIVTGVRPGRS